MTRAVIPLILLGLGLFDLVCEAQPAAVHDYIFSVTGAVQTEDNEPLQDAEITLEVSGPVYDAVTPVTTVRRLTDSTGGFVFSYISHKRGVKYRITARKPGFEPQTVSGSSPPASNRVIHLKKTVG